MARASRQEVSGDGRRIGGGWEGGWGVRGGLKCGAEGRGERASTGKGCEFLCLL